MLGLRKRTISDTLIERHVELRLQEAALAKEAQEAINGVNATIGDLMVERGKLETLVERL